MLCYKTLFTFHYSRRSLTRPASTRFFFLLDHAFEINHRRFLTPVLFFFTYLPPTMSGNCQGAITGRCAVNSTTGATLYPVPCADETCLVNRNFIGTNVNGFCGMADPRVPSVCRERDAMYQHFFVKINPQYGSSGFTTSCTRGGLAMVRGVV